jgi:hypothetical protein
MARAAETARRRRRNSSERNCHPGKTDTSRKRKLPRRIYEGADPEWGQEMVAPRALRWLCGKFEFLP